MRHPFVLVPLVAALAAAPALSGQEPAPRPSAPAAQPAPQQPPVTFRAEVNYVEVDARVFDQSNQFVTGLQPGDFEVLEDGKPQKITVFSLVNIPVERAERPLFAAEPIEPDVQTNVRGSDGRVYLLVLDDLHTHPLRSQRVRAAATQFLDRYLGANDVAAVVHTSGRADASQEFTSNPRLLADAVAKFQGRKLRSSTLERLDQEQATRGFREAGERVDDPMDAERGFQARNTLESLKNLANYLGNVHGRRKALLLFSEGIDYDINDVFNNRDATTIITETRETIAAATRANVSFYGIDPRGLATAGDELMEVTSFPEDTTLGINSSSLFNEVRLGQDSLRVLADETGGFAAVNSNDFAGAFRRLVDENSSYYVLGYYSTNDRRDGRFRKIDVRVSRPNVTVRARKGYVAPRGRAEKTELAGPADASTELREAMSSPLPLGELPMAATAAAFKGPAPKAVVVVSALVGGRTLPLEEKDGTFRNELELAVTAVNQSGKAFGGERNTVSLNLNPTTVPRVRAGGFRIVSQIELEPGRYQLRVGAAEGNTNRAGSVIYDLEVPDFGKEPLTISGLALTSVSSTVAPTARTKDPLAQLLPGPLTTYREFPPNDEIAFFTEVYDNERAAHKVDITATVKAEGGQTVFQTREERDSSELAGTAGGYGITARIPLKDFAPGLYVLRVEAQSRLGDRPTAARELVFRVVEVPGQAAARPAAPAQAQEGTTAMTTVAQDQMSGIERARQVVVRSADEWAALWREHAGAKPAPEVDFTTEMVAAVFLGSRSSAGYEAHIVETRRAGEALVVVWEEVRPAPGTMTAQVMTSPAHIVRLPKTAGEVRFEQRERRPGA